MKKLLSLIFLILFNSEILKADDYSIKAFDNWLYKNGHTQYVQTIDICKQFKKWSDEWVENYCFNFPNGKKGFKNNLNIKIYDRYDIPWGAKPNKGTLLFYLYKYLDDENGFDRIGSKGSDNPYKFKIQLKEDKVSKYIKKHMQKTALLSYLLYEDGKITIDEISPKDRFGILYNNNTQYTSASVGKSIASYVTGHAICKGYISGIDHKLNDWPLLENTLFYDQKLINLLNMATGHQKYADFNLKTNKYNKNGNSNTVEFHMQKGIFKNSKKSKSKYHYTNVLSNVLINYVWFKSEGKFQDLLDEIFVDKAMVENDVWFLKMNDESIKRGNRNNTILKEYKVRDEDGPIRYSFRASRYDYLRIAKAMLDDWQNDTCVGKYLKNLYERRIPKNDKWKDNNSPSLNPKSYAGKFYTNYSGMSKRNIMGMNGYGGQNIMIDFDLGRIVVINSIHTNYNWKKIAHSVIKKGK